MIPIGKSSRTFHHEGNPRACVKCMEGHKLSSVTVCPCCLVLLVYTTLWLPMLPEESQVYQVFFHPASDCLTRSFGLCRRQDPVHGHQSAQATQAATAPRKAAASHSSHRHRSAHHGRHRPGSHRHPASRHRLHRPANSASGHCRTFGHCRAARCHSTSGVLCHHRPVLQSRHLATTFDTFEDSVFASDNCESQGCHRQAILPCCDTPTVLMPPNAAKLDGQSGWTCICSQQDRRS